MLKGKTGSSVRLMPAVTVEPRGVMEEISCHSGSECLGGSTLSTVAVPRLETVITMVKEAPRLRGVGDTVKKLSRLPAVCRLLLAWALMVEPRPSKATALWEKVTAP